MTLATTTQLKRQSKRVTIVTLRCDACFATREISPENPMRKGDVPICECGSPMLPVKAVLR